MAISATERHLVATIAAHESWAKTENRTARTARAAQHSRHGSSEAGGDPVRAESLRKAYFARLALRSAKARREAKS